MRIDRIVSFFALILLCLPNVNAQSFQGNFTREYQANGEIKCAHYIVKEDGYGCVTMILDDHEREKGVSVTCKRDTMGNRKVYINTYHESKVLVIPTSFDRDGNVREFEIMYAKREPEVYTK